MDWVDRTDEDAGPEAGVPTKAKWKMNCRRGVIGRLARKMVVLNYTYLHAFTRFYTRFLDGNVGREMECGSRGVMGCKPV